jgi:hypothetical protein
MKLGISPKLRWLPFDPRKSPLVPPFDSAQGMLFQRGVTPWDLEESKTECKKFPPF